MTKLQAIKAQKEAEERYQALLATGKFVNTGVKYSPVQAMRDSNNSALRLTAQTDDNGNVRWIKD